MARHGHDGRSREHERRGTDWRSSATRRRTRCRRIALPRRERRREDGDRWRRSDPVRSTMAPATLSSSMPTRPARPRRADWRQPLVRFELEEFAGPRLRPVPHRPGAHRRCGMAGRQLQRHPGRRRERAHPERAGEPEALLVRHRCDGHRLASGRDVQPDYRVGRSGPLDLRQPGRRRQAHGGRQGDHGALRFRGDGGRPAEGLRRHPHEPRDRHHRLRPERGHQAHRAGRSAGRSHRAGPAFRPS